MESVNATLSVWGLIVENYESLRIWEKIETQENKVVGLRNSEKVPSLQVCPETYSLRSRRKVTCFLFCFQGRFLFGAVPESARGWADRRQPDARACAAHPGPQRRWGPRRRRWRGRWGRSWSVPSAQAGAVPRAVPGLGLRDVYRWGARRRQGGRRRDSPAGGPGPVQSHGHAGKPAKPQRGELWYPKICLP